MNFPWIFYGCSMNYSMNSMNVPLIFYELSMDLPLIVYEISMKFLWMFYGFSMDFRSLSVDAQSRLLLSLRREVAPYSTSFAGVRAQVRFRGPPMTWETSKYTAV